MSIKSDVILKVKSGPGEIIGDVERELVNGGADFTGIQFSDPGRYVIEVVPTNNDISGTEFTIIVEPEEEIIPQEDSSESDERENGNRPIIAQINQPSINLKPMEFDTTDNSQDNSEILTSLGYVPFFWYNGIQIKPEHITKFFLYYENNIPRCRVVFKDTLGLIESPETAPLNDTKFEIFINSGSEILKSIHLRFKLEICQKNKNETFTIQGSIDLSDFYTTGYKSYNGTSFEVLKKISSELSLGFNSNIDNTDDRMIWRRNGVKRNFFIKNIIEHSYISDNSFLRGYIDYYWSFNFVDLEKEWKRDISNDVGINSQGIGSIAESGGESKKIAPLILTNEYSENSSSFFFSDYRLNNNSTHRTIETGIYTVSKVYDRSKKQFLMFDIDSLTSGGDDKIILKGAPGTDNYTSFITSYGGKIDTDNVHSNYFYAVEQNKRNLDTLLNISVEMSLPQPNFNLYKYQKVQVNFVNKKQTVSNEKIIDERMSGHWLIVDISYSLMGGSLTQKLVLVRKELGKTKKEIEEQVVAPIEGVNNSEINENEPIATGVLENPDAVNINSRVILSVKSGPGEIIGDLERDLVDGIVDFTGIQFSDPGEYIVVATPTNNLELSSVEFVINVSEN